jgi:NAD(P)-dependent dehydrogenase (short-subunit alcohol dehydrogenase family)
MATNLLAGQRVLVTGAGRGIGRAIAQICYAEGARVAITARNRAELEETAAICTESTSGERPPGMLILPNCDVTKEHDVEAMVKEVIRQFGGLDILINNAGGAQPVKGPVISLKSNDLRNLLDLNVVSVHTVTSTVLRHTSDNSQLKHIINISSRAGKIGIPGMGFYVASKFALEGYSATLAEELRDSGTVVNTLSPGMVDTVSFPKAPGQEGVRTPESVEESLLALLQQTIDFTGHYLHADELDETRAKGLPDAKALKPINERKFSA